MHLQGNCRHPLPFPLGSNGTGHAHHVCNFSALGGRCLCGQHMDGHCGQLLLCAKLLVPEWGGKRLGGSIHLWPQWSSLGKLSGKEACNEHLLWQHCECAHHNELVEEQQWQHLVGCNLLLLDAIGKSTDSLMTIPSDLCAFVYLDGCPCPKAICGIQWTLSNVLKTPSHAPHATCMSCMLQFNFGSPPCCITCPVISNSAVFL